MKKEQLLNIIDNTSDVDDGGFQKVIFFSLEYKFVTPKQLARQIDASLPTIERWKYGRSSPHPLMRKHIFAAIKDLLNKSSA